MFGFKNPFSTVAFTTKFVVDDRQPITYVYHDEDDDSWQFMSDDFYLNYSEVAVVVPLNEIINIDESILKVANMPPGYCASRESPFDDWEFEKYEEDMA